MRRHLQQGRGKLVGFALLSAFATAVYLLTMDRSVSWWDCGEFIATGYLLQVGHPPGAPVYQLLSHLFMLLSFGDPMLVAPMSNALSALAGGLTVGILYLTIHELTTSHFSLPTSHFSLPTHLPAVVGALCYLFCDTAWFSAVESEVYSLAMLFCAADLWIALRYRRKPNDRLLLLLALLLGLGVGVHLMTLLVAPALTLIVLPTLVRRSRWGWVLPAAALFFALGLTPYLIVPIRAAANPPINEGNPSTAESFMRYMKRDQYAKAPLYPRMWRERDAANWRDWNYGLDGVAGNAVYYVNYQLGYMYGRYLMYNFIGRENLAYNPAKSNFSLLNFHFSLFILPFLLGLWGLLRHRRRSRCDFWVVMLLFLFGGAVLNLYLNHPCYEPRERDYAYVLSFYAFAIWIGVGADNLLARSEKRKARKYLVTTLILLAPLTMAVGNWRDHDRHNSHSVHDIALNHLQSCDHGALLVTLGDNDTFPIWYLQHVERRRTDIEVCNINLNGYRATMALVDSSFSQRPVYFSQYFVDRFGRFYEGRLRCEGFCWRLLHAGEDSADAAPLLRHINDSIEWHIAEGEYLDNVSKRFLSTWDRNLTLMGVAPETDR